MCCCAHNLISCTFTRCASNTLDNNSRTWEGVNTGKIIDTSQCKVPRSKEIAALASISHEQTIQALLWTVFANTGCDERKVSCCCCCASRCAVIITWHSSNSVKPGTKVLKCFEHQYLCLNNKESSNMSKWSAHVQDAQNCLREYVLPCDNYEIISRPIALIFLEHIWCFMSHEIDAQADQNQSWVSNSQKSLGRPSGVCQNRTQLIATWRKTAYMWTTRRSLLQRKQLLGPTFVWNQLHVRLPPSALIKKTTVCL